MWLDVTRFTVVTVLSFMFFSYMCGAEGSKSKIIALVFDVGNYTVHIHHWLIFTIFLIVLFYVNVKRYLHDILLGFSVGAILQGLSYSDWYVFVTSK